MKDKVLPSTCSKQLYDAAGEPKEPVLYDKDGHDMAVHREEMLNHAFQWIIDVLRRP